ncbi:MAG: hypothetical protein HeimC3_07830 [Candidatus Heimdallarchaeota archaeon LC_3]|nr:MAG: hypothetical protein HeimC3_07830 [Candidatus Heimdallarchaeota archaeon LC_3]
MIKDSTNRAAFYIVGTVILSIGLIAFSLYNNNFFSALETFPRTEEQETTIFATLLGTLMILYGLLLWVIGLLYPGVLSSIILPIDEGLSKTSTISATTKERIQRSFLWINIAVLIFISIVLPFIIYFYLIVIMFSILIAFFVFILPGILFLFYVITNDIRIPFYAVGLIYYLIVFILILILYFRTQKRIRNRELKISTVLIFHYPLLIMTVTALISGITLFLLDLYDRIAGGFSINQNNQTIVYTYYNNPKIDQELALERVLNALSSEVFIYIGGLFLVLIALMLIYNFFGLLHVRVEENREKVEKFNERISRDYSFAQSSTFSLDSTSFDNFDSGSEPEPSKELYEEKCWNCNSYMPPQDNYCLTCGVKSKK